MRLKTTLEIACFNLESALLAQSAGADRIELCDNYAEGGTTPSKGTIELALQHLHIPFLVMIRPRGGDFIYTDLEFEIMQKDIDFCMAAGVKGIVLGMLSKEGNIDAERTAALVKQAEGLQITFHKAFDEVTNKHKALDELITLGIHRVLTSGGEPMAIAGVVTLSKLKEQAAGRIQILAGGGLRSNNILELKEITGLHEFHSAAITNKNASFPQPDVNEIKAIKALL